MCETLSCRENLATALGLALSRADEPWGLPLTRLLEELIKSIRELMLLAADTEGFLDIGLRSTQNNSRLQ